MEDATETLLAYEEQAMNRVLEQATDFDVVEDETSARAMPVVQQTKPIVASTATPADLVRYAIESGADLDRLERLMDMQIKWEANEARKAFAEAMAEFKKNPPTIFKDKHVEFRTDKGVTAYDHATIGNVVEKVVAALAEHGFSHKWTPARSEGGMISITCVVTHRLGHSEETKLEAGLDQSGGKNNIQAMSSTVSYLERYSLLAATGLATRDMQDDDGRGSQRSDEAQETLEGWIKKAKESKSRTDLEKIWKDGVKAIKPLKDMQAYNEFKDAVEKKGADFQAAEQS